MNTIHFLVRMELSTFHSSLSSANQIITILINSRRYGDFLVLLLMISSLIELCHRTYSGHLNPMQFVEFFLVTQHMVNFYQCIVCALEGIFCSSWVLLSTSQLLKVS